MAQLTTIKLALNQIVWRQISFTINDQMESKQIPNFLVLSFSYIACLLS